jgi:hypothetical protein
MIEIFVGAAWGSNITNAEISIRSDGIGTKTTVSAGMQARIFLSPTALTDIIDLELSVTSDNRAVSVYAGNIPIDAIIAIVGSNILRFDAQIYHREPMLLSMIRTCTLKCTPNDMPMIGPGCRECNESGLIFKVCC